MLEVSSVQEDMPEDLAKEISDFIAYEFPEIIFSVPYAETHATVLTIVNKFDAHFALNVVTGIALYGLAKNLLPVDEPSIDNLPSIRDRLK